MDDDKYDQDDDNHADQEDSTSSLGDNNNDDDDDRYNPTNDNDNDNNNNELAVPNDDAEDEDDGYLADAFVRKLHLVRDITQSPLNSLIEGFSNAFGENTIKKLLVECCLQHLELIGDIDDDRACSILRESLIYNDEQFNPNNPALLNILPKKVISKCFSYLDFSTLLCGIELTCRDWFHIARNTTSCGHLNVNFDLKLSTEKNNSLERFHSIETLEFNNSSLYSVNMLLKEAENDLFDYTLSNVDRLKFRDCIYPQFIQACPKDFLSNLRILEIEYRDDVLDSKFWNKLNGKCSQLRNLRLNRLLINQQNYPSLNKFIESCTKLNEFSASYWKFETKMNINDSIAVLATNCTKLNILNINHCRIDDKVTPSLLQLMTLKLRELSIVSCKRLKNDTYKELGRKQSQFLVNANKDVQPRVLLRKLEIDDEMIAANIFDQFVGIRSLQISADHLSGVCKWSSLNRYQSLSHVEFHFRSNLERMNTHSQFMFDWEQFFQGLGNSLEIFICNCIVSDASGGKANAYYTSAPSNNENNSEAPVKVPPSTTTDADAPTASINSASKGAHRTTNSKSGSASITASISTSKTPVPTTNSNYGFSRVSMPESSVNGGGGHSGGGGGGAARPKTARFRGVTMGTQFDVSAMNSNISPDYVVESFTGQRRSSLTQAISFLNAKSNEFMIIDGNIFKYIVKYCKKLKVLTMSGWKFDGIGGSNNTKNGDASNNSDDKGNNNNNKKRKSSELVQRRSSISKSNDKKNVGFIDNNDNDASMDQGNIDIDVVDVIDESDEDYETENEEKDNSSSGGGGDNNNSIKKKGVKISIDTTGATNTGGKDEIEQIDINSIKDKNNTKKKPHPKALKHRSKSVAVIGMQQLKFINDGLDLKDNLTGASNTSGISDLETIDDDNDDDGGNGQNNNGKNNNNNNAGLTAEELIRKKLVKDTLTGRKGFATESTFEKNIMDPLSGLLEDDAEFAIYTIKGRKMRRQLEHVQLEWLFDFGDIPALSTLSFWSDVVLGLKLSMTLNEQTTDESVVIMEWSDNWDDLHIRPKIIHRSVNNKMLHGNKKGDDNNNNGSSGGSSRSNGGDTVGAFQLGAGKKKNKDKTKDKKKKVQFGAASAEEQFD